MIIMRSSTSNTKLVFDPDNNNYVLGQQGAAFQLSQGNTPILYQTPTSSTFYGDIVPQCNVYVGCNVAVSGGITASYISTSNLYLNQSYSVPSTIPYLLASNSAGPILSASSDGYVNIIGKLGIGTGTVSRQNNYSLQVDKDVFVGGTLYATDANITTNINTQRITSSRNGNTYFQFDTSGNSNATLAGDLTVTGKLYAGSLGLTSANVTYNILNVTSNLTTASFNIANTCNITTPAFQLAYKTYNNSNLSLSNININPIYVTVNSVPGFIIDQYGQVMFGTSNAAAAMTLQYSSNFTTCNMLAIFGQNQNSNNNFVITNDGNVGVGTTLPLNRLHLTQNALDVTSNNPVIGIYSSNSDFIGGYSNGVSMFYVSSNGIISATGLNVSTIQTSSIATSSFQPIDPTNPNVSYSNMSLCNIASIYSTGINNSDTVTTDSLVTNNLTATNVFIPNVQIYNLLGYYGVFQPQMVFTGSNIVMSSLDSDRVSSPPGKLVVRSETVPATSANSVGLNIVGTQNNSIRVTSTTKPSYELIGPNTATYISATSSTYPNTTPQMFYISHMSGSSTPENTFTPQFQMLPAPGGTIIENNIYMNSGSLGINLNGFANPNYKLQVRSSFLVDRASAGNAPILYAKESSSASGPIYVGVGTLNPNYELHVAGTTYTSCNILTNGSIGIGTTSPISSLHVVGTSYFTSNIGIGSTTPQYGLDIVGSSSTSCNIYVGCNIAVGTKTPAQSLHVVGGAYITSNVGIGTQSPKYLLDVNGSAHFASNLITDGGFTIGGNLTVNGSINGTLSTSSSNQPNISQLSNVNINYLTINNAILSTNIDGYSSYVTSNTQVNITTMPNITSMSTASSNLTIGKSTTNTYITGPLYTQVYTPSQPYINNMNTVTISTLTATNIITGSVSGSAATVTQATQPNITTLPNLTSIGSNVSTTNVAGSLTTTGTAIFSSNVSVRGILYTYGNVASLSDSNIKTNIVPISEPLEKVSRLTGYTYDRTDQVDSRRECGLLAQDVQKVLPELVRMSEDNLLTISYGNMAGLFVEALKLLQTQVRDLQAEVAELRRK
jgi:hypothetical protein